MQNLAMLEVPLLLTQLFPFSSTCIYMAAVTIIELIAGIASYDHGGSIVIVITTIH